jgi:alkylated DNA repair dioxygenase AlkB
MRQPDLFASRSLPPGLRYQDDFLSAGEESDLIHAISRLPLREAQYKEYTAKRRIVSYGARYDFSSNELLPAGPLPPFLHPLRQRVAAWMQVQADELQDALVAEYRPGTQLGWHRDVPDFEAIAGISLGGRARMRLRPLTQLSPPQARSRGWPRRVKAIALELEPRSAYSMTGEARWGWQHAISPTKDLRYSITFRTRAGAR